MAGIYLHIPFCKRICAYCDFYKSADLRQMDALIEAMHRELDARRGYLGGEAVETRYFGGGTPSLCPPEEIGALLRHTEELFDCSRAEETTLEANPDDLTPRYLAAVRRAGIDRLSIGIQSFDDDCLKLMNRRHTARQAAEAVHNAQKEGFGNITVDLIFGVPGFGGDSLRRSLGEAIGLGVQHISAYHLTIEPDTAFGRRAARGAFAPVEEQVSEEEFLTVHDTLTAAGFEHYEVSNFALPGFRARHNAAYWHGEIPRNRPRSPLVRRAGAALEPGIGRALHRRRRGGMRDSLPARPLQRVRHDPAADSRRDRPGRSGRTFRYGIRRTDPPRGRAVDRSGRRGTPRCAPGPAAPPHAAFGRGHREPFRNITGRYKQVKPRH